MTKKMIQVMRMSFPDDPTTPDCTIHSRDDLEQALDDMWGEADIWKNFIPGTRFVITFEEMSQEEFDALEEWER